MIAACDSVGGMSSLVTLAAPRIDRGVVTDERIDVMLAADAVVAAGVSGGKDSVALAFALWEHLDRIGHRGPRVLVHADLGRVEWRDSLPTCERLALALGAELLVVKREQGDMMDRWLQRWRDNVQRYAALSCVKLILPWSTPDMRFCTSELKVAQICKGLVSRFPGRQIVSASGIRREESRQRKNAPISKVEKGLHKIRAGTSGATWNPILEWLAGDVRAIAAARGFRPHEGYTRWNMSRISCAFCIMQDDHDQRASAAVPEHAPLLREMADLEIASTFAFQGDRWLGDVRPDLLTEPQRAALAFAKERGAERERMEAWLPDHLLYTKGWPHVMPTDDEAERIAAMRRGVAAAVRIDVQCTTGPEVKARYAELMADHGECDCQNRGA